MPAVANPLVLFPVAPAGTLFRIRIKRTSDSVTQDVDVSFTAGELLWSSGDLGTTAGERDIAKMALDALNTNTLGITWTLSTSATTHRFTFTSSSSAQLLWSVLGSDRFDPAWLGYTTADTTAGTTHAAPNQPDGLWAPARPFVFDSRKEPVLVGALTRSISGVTRGYVLSIQQDRTVRWARLPRPKILTEYAAATEPRSTLQRLYEQAAEKRIRLYDDEANHAGGSTTYQRLVFRDLVRPWNLREGEAGTRYDAELRLAEYVT